MKSFTAEIVTEDDTLDAESINHALDPLKKERHANCRVWRSPSSEGHRSVYIAPTLSQEDIELARGSITDMLHLLIVATMRDPQELNQLVRDVTEQVLRMVITEGDSDNHDPFEPH